MADCKYCNPEKFENINIGREIDSKLPLTLTNWGGQIFISADLGREYNNQYHPKFCPECGRRIRRPEGVQP